MRVRKLLVGGLLAVALVGGGVAWLERGALRTWWVLRGLKGAGEADRAAWIDRVAELPEPPVEGLLDCLGSGDERACRNAAEALDRLARAWGAADPRTAELAGKLARSYGRLCP